MRYLITGGSGFIGFALANKLALKEKNKIVLVDNFSRGAFDKKFNLFIRKDNVELIKGDLLKDSTWEKIGFNYDYCFHLAAKVGVKNVISDPYSTLSDNVKMTDLAVKNFKNSKILKKFIFMSTSEIYAGSINYSYAKIPTPETTLLTLPNLSFARTSYMLSKIYGEALLQSSGLGYIIFRPHNIFGPRMGMSHVIPELLKKIYTNDKDQSLEVFSPEHTRTFCYINDAVNMMILAIKNSNESNYILNLGNDSPEIKISDLAKKLLKITGNKEILTELEESQGSPKRRCPDIKKIIELTKYNSFVPLEDSLRETKDWYFSKFENKIL